jgi:hypothetical protein
MSQLIGFLKRKCHSKSLAEKKGYMEGTIMGTFERLIVKKYREIRTYFYFVSQSLPILLEVDVFYHHICP